MLDFRHIKKVADRLVGIFCFVFLPIVLFLVVYKLEVVIKKTLMIDNALIYGLSLSIITGIILDRVRAHRVKHETIEVIIITICIPILIYIGMNTKFIKSNWNQLGIEVQTLAWIYFYFLVNYFTRKLLNMTKKTTK